VTFGERLAASLEETGHLCVGIDPHATLLTQWGMADNATGLREFGLRAVEAVRGRAGIIKPQVAFFERHGSEGFAALEAVLASARAEGLLIIGDAKRGDIGSTMDGYAEAWLRSGSPLEVDALTVSGYLGADSLAETNAFARANDKGLFVLSATSNPEAARLQAAREANGTTVAASIVDTVHQWNSQDNGLGSAGVVIGATVQLTSVGIDDDAVMNMPILAPGFGFQGARVSDLATNYGRALPGVVVSSSRALLNAGPEGLADAIDAQVLALRGAFGS
jgi:orotidine-5'-phosphate decarboxylase